MCMKRFFQLTGTGEFSLKIGLPDHSPPPYLAKTPIPSTHTELQIVPYIFADSLTYGERDTILTWVTEFQRLPFVTSPSGRGENANISTIR